MSIKLKLEGFEDLLKEIEKAGGEIKPSCEAAMKESAQIMDSELKTQMKSAGVPSDLVAAMPPPEIQSEGNRVSARVGYKKGAYNAQNPSDGYKAVFLNYGTPNRSKHGKIAPRGFVVRAKNRARSKIKKTQEETFKKILAGLKK